MINQDLVDAVAAKTGNIKALAAETLDALLGTITATVAKGDTVQLIGFGAFRQGRARHELGAIRQRARRSRSRPRKR
ncbi:nucleoid DNA-binding protein [Paraburkholderia graminis]|nr:nucleoid DNA-binding protein [Paraburkholderia graminis]